MTDIRRTNRDIVEKFFRYSTSPLPTGDDLLDLKNMFSKDAVWQMPFMPAPLQKAMEGRALIGHFLDWFFAHVPDLEVVDRVVHETADPGLFVIEFKGRATVTTTGKPYHQTYVLMMYIEDGKLVRLREHFDAMVVWDSFGGEKGLTDALAEIVEAATSDASA